MKKFIEVDKEMAPRRGVGIRRGCALCCKDTIDRDSVHDIAHTASPGKIERGFPEPLHNRSDCLRTTHPFRNLVADIACVEIGEYQHVCISFDGTAGSLSPRHLRK